MYMYSPHPLTLNDHASQHDWDELTGLEDDLSGIVQIAEGWVGEAHGRYCQEANKSVHSKGNPTVGEEEGKELPVTIFHYHVLQEHTELGKNTDQI